jgi:pimeloyl-ACP methyl ester carboxylesterase
MAVHNSDVRIATCNGIEIAYETFGERTSPPVLLIMGLGTQMILWDEEFCSLLAARGFWVIRFDNRDIGLSSKLDGLGLPNVFELLRGNTVQLPYTLLDMADDAVSLLDALDIPSAHILGISMGGMIAQLMAIHHPGRVLTLGSFMSTTSNPALPPPKPEAIQILFKPIPVKREPFIDHFMETWRVLNGDRMPMDEERVRRFAEQTFARGIHPPGNVRQLAAILTAPIRKHDLSRVAVPALVIHGDADPLVPVACGIDTAESIPGARLHIIPEMGHMLHPLAWKEIVDAVEDLAAQREDLGSSG